MPAPPTSAAAARARAAEPLGRQVWLTALVVALGSLVGILSTTTPNVAFNTLSTELGSPLSSIQWVATGYMLGLAAVIPASGWIARRVGARRAYLWSLGFFVIASGVCALAQTTEQLIGARVLQGLAGGISLPVGQMMLAAAAGPDRMGRVMSVIGVPMILAPSLGPAVGGALVEQLSWHWIFVINVPFGLAAIVAGAKILPKVPRVHHEDDRLDVLGMALLTLGVPLLVYGLAETGEGGFAQAGVLGPLVAGTVLVAAFVRHALRSSHPLLNVRLLGHSGFAAASLTVAATGAALFGAMLLMPLYFETVRGEDPMNAGLLLIPQGVGAALAMAVTGRLADRVGGGRVSLVGVTLLALATIPFTFFAESTSYWLIGVALVLRGFATGSAIMPAMAAAYATLHRSDISHATPQLNVFQRVGGSFGTAILTVVLTTNITAQVGAGAVGGGGAQPSDAVREQAAPALAAAFGTTFWWAFAIAALAIVPAYVLTRVEGRARAEARAEEARHPEQLEADGMPAGGPPAEGPQQAVREPAGARA